MRSFQARELLIPAFSPELKDFLWTKNAYALVGLPGLGPGKHPKGQDMSRRRRTQEKKRTRRKEEL